jgi:rSAM/selenodomain-associated transferase 1
VRLHSATPGPRPGDVLGVFAKSPQPGRVKTRLAAVTTPAWAARLADALLRDTLDRCAAVPVRRVLAFDPPDAGPFFAGIAGTRFELEPQAAGDLGRRMEAFFRARVADGAERIVLIGTDSPTVPIVWIEQAFPSLATADVVLGPATDGGYYLIGCARRVPPVFAAIAWGGPTVLADTIARLSDPAWRLALLPPWYDVDTFADWQMLRGHLSAQCRAGLDPGVPHLERLEPPPAADPET